MNSTVERCQLILAERPYAFSSATVVRDGVQPAMGRCNPLCAGTLWFLWGHESYWTQFYLLVPSLRCDTRCASAVRSWRVRRCNQSLPRALGVRLDRDPAGPLPLCSGGLNKRSIVC